MVNKDTRGKNMNKKGIAGLKRASKEKEQLKIVLIMCEGETEVNYFKPTVDKLVKAGKLSAKSAVLHGKNTDPSGVLDNLIEYKKRLWIKRKEGDSFWIVIDRDPQTAQTGGSGHTLDNFNEAIERAKKDGVHVAWSNPCFEYFLALHFHLLEGDMLRGDMVKKVDEYMEKAGLGGYKKNPADLYKILASRIDIAIKNAQKIADKNTKKIADKYISKVPSECKPGTNVHLLVKELQEMGKTKEGEATKEGNTAKDGVEIKGEGEEKNNSNV